MTLWNQWCPNFVVIHFFVIYLNQLKFPNDSCTLLTSVNQKLVKHISDPCWTRLFLLLKIDFSQFSFLFPRTTIKVRICRSSSFGNNCYDVFEITRLYIHLSLIEKAWGSLFNYFLVANTKFYCTSFSSGKIKRLEIFDIFKKIGYWCWFSFCYRHNRSARKQYYKNDCYNTSNN